MLTAGENFLHYDIVSAIGEGGMGEVYLAKDRHLERKVAIKLLRKKFVNNEAGLRRFVLEAKAASALNHPNIITIYEIGRSDDSEYIATEYIEGHTLHRLLALGGLDLEEILNITIQVAEALNAAHNAGIVHRDIKPENIMVRNDGYVKVLDFGLAKLLDQEDVLIDGTAVTQKMFETNPGVIMGTVSYMSPEQARGKAVDTRTDIWSLGVVLFQMLTGRLPFTGETTSDVVAALLKAPIPKLGDFVPDTPKELEHVLDKALRRDCEERYQNIKDLLIDLKDLKQELNLGGGNGHRSDKRTGFFEPPATTGNGRAGASTLESPSTARTHSISELFLTQFRVHPRIMAVAGTLILFIFIVAGWGVSRWISNANRASSLDALRPVKLVSWKSGGSSGYPDYAASHDGKVIAFSSVQSPTSQEIFIKQTANSSIVRVTNDRWRNYDPIWAPDDQALAYVSYRDGSFGIYKCGFLGGDSVLLARMNEGSLSLRHWSNDGSAIFYEFNGNLFQLELATRVTRQITDFEPSRITRRDFALSPDESEIVYSNQNGDQSDLWVRPIVGGTPVQLTHDADEEIQPVWHPDGKRILYSVTRNGHLQISVAYLTGQPSEQVTRGDRDYRIIDVSKDGTKIFYSTWEDRSDVWSVDVQTSEESVVANTEEAEFWPDVSPDGKSILYQTDPVPNPASAFEAASIIIKPVKGGGPSRVIRGFDSRWTPDSKHITFLRWKSDENRNALWTADVANGEEKEIVSGWVVPASYAGLPFDRMQTQEYNWSPDQREIAYLSVKSGASNVSAATEDSDEVLYLTRNSDSSVTYYCPIWSPNGKRLAFTSVKRVPGAGAKPATSVWITDQGTTAQIYSTTDRLRLLGWSTQDKLLFESADAVIQANPQDIKILEVSLNGDAKIVTTFQNIYALSMTLSDNGNSLAFTARKDDKDTICVYSFGGSARVIAASNDPTSFFGSPTWSPDGKNIFFDKQEKINTISMFENFR